ncbi:hypothetical protein [Nocardiopsis alba]|uniref:hypothetical protein n=1 Tax=Nocardiopsis alba TaxID=53437 RepID=UPI003D73424E
MTRTAMRTHRRGRLLPVLLVVITALHMMCAVGWFQPDPEHETGPRLQASTAERIAEPAPSSVPGGQQAACEQHHPGGTDLVPVQERGAGDQGTPPVTDTALATLCPEPWPSISTGEMRALNTRHARRRRENFSPLIPLCVWRI